MKVLNCCLECNGYDKVKKVYNNSFRCLFCDKHVEELSRILHEQQKGDKGCSTCKNCRHVRNYPGFVTGEECECDAGLECDTVCFSVHNCPKWIDRYEENKNEQD